MRAFPEIPTIEEERLKAESRLLCKTDLHYLAKEVLGYNRLTDHYHARMAQDIDTPNYKFKLLLHPRGHFKSTIGTEARSVKKLLVNPDERILLTNVKLANSRKFLRAIAHHFEANPRLRWLWREWWIRQYATPFHKADMGDRLDWIVKNTQDEFTLLRPNEGREASITTGALDASMVSQHYSTILADDLVNREYVRTVEGVERSILYFKDLLDLLDPGGELCLIGCVTGDTKILMGDSSWKKIVDVTAGDMVYSYKDKKPVVRKVLAQIPQGEDDVFEIKTDRHTVRANARHPFLVVRNATDIEGGGEHTCGELSSLKQYAPKGICERCDVLRDAWREKWVRADELKVGDKVLTVARVNRDTCKHHYDGRRLTSDFFWLLGYLFGDGWLLQSENRGVVGVACALSAHDAENQKVLDLFEKWFYKRPSVTEYGYVRLDCQKTGLWLKELGFFGRAKDKRVPEWITKSRTCYKKAFIDGLIEADGSKIRGDGYRVELCNQGLVEDIYWLALTCGYRPTTIYERTREIQAPNSPKPVESTTYSIGLTYNTRQAWGLNQYNWRWERIKSIEHRGKEEVFDLTIEDSENFIANGYVTHNTRWAHMDLYGWIIEEFGGVASLVVPKGYVKEEVVAASEKCPDKDKRWLISIQPCYGDDGEPVFPEEFTKDVLTELERVKGPYEFGAQYNLNPTSKEGQKFKDEWFQYLDVMPDPKHLSVCITVDPAKSLLDNADMSAIVAYGYDKSNYMYLLDGINERLTVDELPEALFQFVRKWHGLAKFVYPVGFESVGFQETYIHVLQRMMLERNFFFGIEPIARRVQSKEERILRLVPRVKNGFYIPRRLMIQPFSDREPPYDLTQRLLWELIHFPLAGRDDLADATADQLEIVIPSKLPDNRPNMSLPNTKPDFIHPSILSDRQHSLRRIRAKQRQQASVR